MPIQSRDRVFVSYSHKDKDWLEKFSAVLAPDIRNGRVEYWDDRELQPGDPWYAKILDGIHTARVAVLLVSPNFLASRFIMEEELPRILAARDDGLTLVWIPLFGTFYGPESPPQMKAITAVQAAVDAGKPLAEQEPASQTALLLDACRKIQKLINPGRVPRNLPFVSLDDRFKGRDQALAELDESMHRQGAAAVFQPTVLIGTGGVGKTRLALEYACRHEKDFSAFLFVSANTSEDLEANLAKLCADSALDLPEAVASKQDDQVAAVIRWLQSNRGWLLILDNVDDGVKSIQAVKNLVSKLSGGHIIVTSRLFAPDWNGGVRTIGLRPLDIEAAQDFLLTATEQGRHTTKADTEQARLLADTLGCLPLALTHAAAYIATEGRTFDAYITEFSQKFDSLLQRHLADPIDYDPCRADGKDKKTVATTFFMSFDRLGAMEKALLRTASLLGFAPIPCAMFEANADATQALADLWSEEFGDPRSEISVRDALSNLARYSLLDRKDGLLTMHRMEWEIMRHKVPPTAASRWLACAAAVVVLHAPKDSADNPITWSLWDILRPHAEAVVNHPSALHQSEPEMQLMAALRGLHIAQGRFPDALVIGRQCLGLLTHAAPDSTASADAHTAVAKAYRALNMLGDAEVHARRALAIHEILGTTNTPSLAASLVQLGEVLYAQGRLAEREPLYRQALAILESHFGHDHSTVAEALNNLASAVQDTRDFTQAEKLYLDCLATASRSVSPHYPDLCDWNNNLASLYSDTKRPALAAQSYEKAIAVIRNGPIPDHPKLVVPLMNLAFIRAGKILSGKSAVKLADEALTIRTKYFSDDDSATEKIRLQRAQIIALCAFRNANLIALPAAVTLSVGIWLVPNLNWSIQLLLSLLGFLVPFIVAAYHLRPHLQTLLPGARLAASAPTPAAPKMTPSQANLLAVTLQHTGDIDQAEYLYRTGLCHPRLTGEDRRLLLENFAAFLHEFRQDLSAAEARFNELLNDLRSTGDTPDSILLVKLSAMRVSQGRFDEAAGLTTQAWHQHRSHDDGFVPRFPFLRYLIAMLRKEDGNLWLGQFKTGLSEGRSLQPWHVPGLISDVSTHLDAATLNFVKLLADAIGKREHSSSLARHPQWIAATLSPLTQPWPE